MLGVWDERRVQGLTGWDVDSERFGIDLVMYTHLSCRSIWSKTSLGTADGGKYEYLITRVVRWLPSQDLYLC